MFHIGRLTKPDVNKAIEAYQQAARLDKECAAKNLGDLYSGKEESLPAERQDKSTAVYWYEKDSSKDSQAISAQLREEGHQVVINSEHVFYEKNGRNISSGYSLICATQPLHPLLPSCASSSGLTLLKDR